MKILRNGYTHDIKERGKTVVPMGAQQENIKEGNFCFPKYSISVYQTSIDRIRKFEAVGKITLYVISQR